MTDRDYRHVPLGGFVLTDKALAAFGIQPSVQVPLLDLPTYDDERGAA